MSDGARVDPLWGVRVHAFPIERALLGSAPLQRLAGLHHHGPSGRVAGIGASRLEHTLAVHALCVALVPDDRDLRVAALLHDVGHVPYSHALEPLGVDHHRSFERAIDGELRAPLRAAGVDTDRVRDLVLGAERSPLRNRDGDLHLDHLDSFVRGARARGAEVELDAPALVRSLRWDGAVVRAGAAFAEPLLGAILDEARWHRHPVDLGARAWLVELTRRALDAGCLDLGAVTEAVDADLDAALLACTATADEAAALLHGAPRFAPADAEQPARWQVAARAAYLPTPRLDDEPAGWAARCERAFAPLRAPRTVRVAVVPAAPT